MLVTITMRFPTKGRLYLYCTKESIFYSNRGYYSSTVLRNTSSTIPLSRNQVPVNRFAASQEKPQQLHTDSSIITFNNDWRYNSNSNVHNIRKVYLSSTSTATATATATATTTTTTTIDSENVSTESNVENDNKVEQQQQTQDDSILPVVDKADKDSKETTSIPQDNDNEEDKFEIILFQSDTSNIIKDTTGESKKWANTTIIIMRSGLFFSMFNTCYWFWYAFDFIPLINASEYDVLHVSSIYGYLGILFGCTVQFAFLTYPTKYISKLTWKPLKKQLLFYTHTLPFITPSPIPKITYTVGNSIDNKVPLSSLPGSNIQLQQSQQSRQNQDNPIGVLDDDLNILGVPSDNNKKKIVKDRGFFSPIEAMKSLYTVIFTNKNKASAIEHRPLLCPENSNVAKHILNKLNGNIQYYEGQVPMGYNWPYYVIDIQSPRNVPEPELLLEALVRTQFMVKEFLSDSDYKKYGIKKVPSKSKIINTNTNAGSSNRTTTIKRNSGTKVSTAVSSSPSTSSSRPTPISFGKKLNPRKQK